MGKLYFGDNIDVLRDHVADDSVDLVYLDPPFNSNASYNVLFKEPTGVAAEAQAEAFRDTWEWGDSAEMAYDDVLKERGDVALVIRSFRSWLGDNAMMAYLAMMTIRLLEMRRKLKPSGSLYLHCDPKASHYLKVILDAIFGHENFRNEISWKRTGAHGSSKRWGPVHDTLLFYSATDDNLWNRTTQAYEAGYLSSKYRHSDSRGNFQDVSLTGAGVRKGESGQAWRGHNPTEKGRHWAIPGALGAHVAGFAKMSPQVKLDALDAADLIYWPRARGGGDSFPRVKQYPSEGVPIQDVITDIPAINSQAQERLGYPTQKPVALLERIIAASSREGDVVLDPFCGCGTTVEAAERLNRQWIGIDVTHYAITLIEARLRAIHPDTQFQVLGRPIDLAGARDLARRDKHQFQWWAAWLLGSQSYREERRGADRGIDGNIFFKNGPYGDGRIIVSVKGGNNVGVAMVRDLRGVIEREKAEMGILVSLAEPTRAMMTEARGAGFVERTPHGRLPRLQTVTIEQLLDKRLPILPPLPQPERVVRASARRRKDPNQLELLLPFAGEKLGTGAGAVVDPRFVKLARA